MQATYRLLLALCVAPGFQQPVFAGADVERTQRQGQIEAKLTLETAPSSASAGGQLSVRLSGEALTLEITGPPSLEVTAPDPIVQIKNWQVNRIKPEEITVLPTGRRWRGYYRLEPDRPGPATIQFAALEVRISSETQVVQWPPLTVSVVTSIQRASPDELIEDVPLEPFPGLDTGKFSVSRWVGGVLLALGFLGVGYVRLRRAYQLRQEEPAPWIRRRIHALRAQNQGTAEQITRFYSELADLLRYFIERRFAVPAPTRTTREFLDGLQKSAALEVNQKELLERFLARCDLVKFAREAATLADCDAAVELVLGFVDGSAVAKGRTKKANILA
jgi:hypothetical protein